MIFLYNFDCNLLPLFLFTGALIFDFHSVGTFSSVHIISFKLFSMFVSICPPFLQSLMQMLSLPYLCLMPYYFSLILLLFLCQMYRVFHIPVIVRFLYHLYACYRGKYYVQLLSCLEDLESRFSSCSVYLLHLI